MHTWQRKKFQLIDGETAARDNTIRQLKEEIAELKQALQSRDEQRDIMQKGRWDMKQK
jgi:hypothetical protein